MPVWWGVFAYMMIVSAFGMYIYKRKPQPVTLGKSEDTRENEYKSIGLFFALATFVLLVYFTGNRSYIFDTTDYQYAYDNYYTGDLSQIKDIFTGVIKGKGPLFSILLVLFKHFTGGTYNDWFVFVASLQAISLALFFYRYSTSFTMSIYLFMATSSFLWMVNGMRQFVAVTFILLFVEWLKKRKTILFILVIVLAYFIHSSALIWIPVYFIIKYKPWSKAFIWLSLFVTVLLFAYLQSPLIDSSEFSYLNQASYQTGINPLRVIVMAIPTVIAFWKRKIIEEKSNAFVNVWINLSVITTECYIVGMFTSGIIGRIPAYFQPFNYLLLPWMAKYVFTEKSDRVFIVTVYIVLFAYFLFDMYGAKNGVYNSTTLNLHYNFT
jgi:transmembrane protein EpsG